MRNNFRIVAATAVLTAAFLTGGAAQIFAHCQIPCGIYDDEARFAAIAEDITTIEKSMNQIIELSTDPARNMNQLVRWIGTKETHADRISEVVTQYFLTQRIKVAAAGDSAAEALYGKRLALLHQMMVTAMKCKQTTDLVQAKALHDLLHAFGDAYRQ